jgi:hypothetical protein
MKVRERERGDVEGSGQVQPKSVMLGRCRSKTDFSQIPTAY